jgi:hypothetical protein
MDGDHQHRLYHSLPVEAVGSFFQPQGSGILAIIHQNQMDALPVIGQGRADDCQFDMCLKMPAVQFFLLRPGFLSASGKQDNEKDQRQQ